MNYAAFGENGAFCKSDVRVDEFFSTVLSKDQNTDFFFFFFVLTPRPSKWAYKNLAAE